MDEWSEFRPVHRLHFHLDGKAWHTDDLHQIFGALDGLFAYSEARRLLRGSGEDGEVLVEEAVNNAFEQADRVTRPEVRDLTTESSLAFDLIATALSHSGALGIMVAIFKGPDLVFRMPAQYETRKAEYYEAKVRTQRAKNELAQLQAFQVEVREE